MSFADSEVESEIRGAVRQFSDHVRSLPAELRGLTAATSLWTERGAGLSQALPFWLDQEFSGGALRPAARQMALANLFGQVFCLLRDGVIDRHAGTQPEILILLDALFLQFFRGYQKLFPASHPFWSRFEEYWLEYLQALAWEKAHHHGRIEPWEPEDLRRLGRKLSPVKICCAGMAMLAGREGEIPALGRMLEHLETGVGLLDDLDDWREDLAHGDYTYALTLAHLRGPWREGSPPLAQEEVERLLVGQGIAAELLEQARSEFAAGLSAVGHLSLGGLRRVVTRYQEEVGRRLEEAIRRQVKAFGPAGLHLVSRNGHHLALNVATTTLFELDAAAAGLLRRVADGDPDGGSPGDGEILRELRAAGVFAPRPPPRRETPSLKTLYLNVSASCNLRCLYCFASQGRYAAETGLMSRETGERAVDFLLRESGDRPEVKIVFFGGEPLLNRGLITHLVSYGQRQAGLRGKRMRFLVVTNGTLLDDALIDTFRREGVQLHVSLDGPAEVQDRLRPDCRGEGTYERVLRNVRALQEAGVRVGIRATLTSLTPPPVEVLAHLASLGAESIQMELVHPTREDRQPWPEAALPALKQAQEELASYFLEELRAGRLVVFANVVQPLLRIYRRRRFPVHCNAGSAMATVTTAGTVYPCFRFAEEPGLAVGSVETGLDRDKAGSYLRYSVDGQEPCRSCWARYLCGGGCLYHNFLLNGDVARPDPLQCELTRHQLEIAIGLYGRIRRELPGLAAGLESGALAPTLFPEV